jgi:hypothetical protein
MKKNIEPVQTGPVKKYVLYFDINKTIIINDSTNELPLSKE